MTEYKNKVMFLRKSKSGKTLYAFNRDGILGGDVATIIMNIAELKGLLSNESKWIKISALPVIEESSAEKTEKKKDGGK